MTHEELEEAVAALVGRVEALEAKIGSNATGDAVSQVMQALQVARQVSPGPEPEAGS